LEGMFKNKKLYTYKLYTITGNNIHGEHDMLLNGKVFQALESPSYVLPG